MKKLLVRTLTSYIFAADKVKPITFKFLKRRDKL